MTKVTISSRLLRRFHRDRSWKQDVVFKMNVLVQIRFEFRQSSVKRLVADTRVGWSNVTTTGLAHGPQCSTSGVVLVLNPVSKVLWCGRPSDPRRNCAARPIRTRRPAKSCVDLHIGVQLALFAAGYLLQTWESAL